MKRYLLQILIFIIFSGITFLLILSLADGTSDSYYLRVTTPKQQSLILGTSKAAQGVQPQVLNDILGRDDIYNFAFTVAHSPYGPVYLKSVKKKVDPKSNDGIFIVTIDPYSISSRSIEINNVEEFRENGSFLDDLGNINIFPNFPYLIKHYNYSYIYLLTKKMEYINNDYLHSDGWYEVNITMKEKALNERIENKIKEYKIKLEQYNYSEVRYNSLVETIEFLKQHGHVFLVRLPVSKPYLKMENKLMPDFDNKMEVLSQKYDLKYLNFNNSPNTYQYTDGNHLYKASGLEVSKIIAEWIKGNSLEDTTKSENFQ